MFSDPSKPGPAGPYAPPVSRRPVWRWALPLLPALLVLSVVISLVSQERQEQLIADTLWVEQSIRLQLARDEESLQQAAADLISGRLSAVELRTRFTPLLESRRELVRVAWLDVNNRTLSSTDDPFATSRRRSEQWLATAENARRTGKPLYGARRGRPACRDRC